MCKHMFEACAAKYRSSPFCFPFFPVLSAKAHKSPRAHRVTWNPSMILVCAASNPKCQTTAKGSWNQPTNQQAHRQRSLRRQRRAMYERAVKELPAHHHLQALRYRISLSLCHAATEKQFISQKAHDLSPWRRKDTVRFQKPTTH